MCERCCSRVRKFTCPHQCTLARVPARPSDVRCRGRFRALVHRRRKSISHAADPVCGEIGLGSLREVSLAHARERAAKARQKLEAGENPKQCRRTAGEASFGACAEQLIASLRPSWRNDLHASQWQTTLLKDAARLAPIPVDKITTEDVLAVLSPLWQTKRTTAERLRGRIERVLDAAKARGLRPEDKANPARWRGHLDHILPRRGRHEGVRHHAALPFAEVPAFMAALRNEGGMAARALEFAIITAARSGEVLGARWSEIDLDEKTWTVPAERMKAGVLHRVPLSHAARSRSCTKLARASSYFPASAANLTARRCESCWSAA